MINYHTLPEGCMDWACLAAEVLGHEVNMTNVRGFVVPAIRRADGSITQYNPFDPDTEDSLELLKRLNVEIKYWTQHIQISLTHPHWPDGRTATSKMFVKEYTRADVAFSILECFYDTHRGYMLSVERGHAPPPQVPKRQP